MKLQYHLFPNGNGQKNQENIASVKSDKFFNISKDE